MSSRSPLIILGVTKLHITVRRFCSARDYLLVSRPGGHWGYLADFPIEKLKTRTLHLHVFDYDRFSRDDPIGELFIPLQDLDFSQNYDVWKPLLPPKSETKVSRSTLNGTVASGTQKAKWRLIHLNRHVCAGVFYRTSTGKYCCH